MIQILGIAILFALLYGLQKPLYRRWWNRHLKVDIAFGCEHIFEGEQGEVKEMVENRKRLPLPMLKVKFRTDRHLIFEDQKGSRTTDQFYRNDVFRIGGGERVTKTLKFQAGRRGYYTIAEADLVASDLFLSEQMAEQVPVRTHLYVYPRPFESEELQKSMTQLNGEALARRHLLEDPFEYRGIREYQPCDELKSINWKATAKTGNFQVNQKNYTSLKRARIFLNLSDDNILKKEDCVEMCLRIAAALGAFFLRQGMQVACYANGVDCISGKCMAVEANAGSGQMDAIYRALARLDLESPVPNFSDVFEGRLFLEGDGSITCFVAPNQYDDFVLLLKKYSAAGNDFMWFYPVSFGREPERVPELEKQIRLIHLG